MLDKLSITFPSVSDCRNCGKDNLYDSCKCLNWVKNFGIYYQPYLRFHVNRGRIELNPFHFGSYEEMKEILLNIISVDYFNMSRFTRLDLRVDVEGTPQDWASRIWNPSRKNCVHGSSSRIETVYMGKGERILRIYDKGLESGGQEGIKTRIEIQKRFNRKETRLAFTLENVLKVCFEEFSRLKFSPNGDTSINPWVAKKENRGKFRWAFRENCSELGKKCGDGIIEWWGAN